MYEFLAGRQPDLEAVSDRDRLCQAVPDRDRLCQAVSDRDRLCQAVSDRDRLCQAVSDCVSGTMNGATPALHGTETPLDVPNDDLLTLTGPGLTVDPAAAGHYMDAAFAAARDALRHQEVPVGCVLARGGRLLAAGRNTVNATKNATRHAELNCVDQVYGRCAAAGVSAADVWPDTDVFVTVEPCVMCAAALVQLGVRSVTYGAANQRFGGCGSVLDVPGKLMPSRVTFVQDEARVEEAVALLKEFYQGENPNVPRV